MIGMEKKVLISRKCFLLWVERRDLDGRRYGVEGVR